MATAARLVPCVVDTPALPSDGPDIHLKLLHPPAGKPSVDRTGARDDDIIMLYARCIEKSSLSKDTLEELLMPIYEHVTTEPKSYEHLRGLTLQQLWDEVQVARKRLVALQLDNRRLKLDNERMQRESERMQRESERLHQELEAARHQLRMLAKSIDVGLFEEVEPMDDAEQMRLRIQAFLKAQGA